MRPGDLDGKPYARFWQPDMQPLPAHVRQAILHGAEATELGLSLDQADRLMDPGYLPLETGWTRLGNGQTLVAVRTEMPGVTGAMFEWWMGWHTMEDQRYKLWHPRAHLANGTAEMRSNDPGLSDREKYLTTHHVIEYIGSHLQKISICFVEPSNLLGRTSGEGVTAVVCARVEMRDTPVVIAHLIHQIRGIEGGSEMRSRFWLGRPELRNSPPGSLRNRVLGSSVVRGFMVPGDLPHAMLVHCAMEMNHLAGFLPDLYGLYH